MQSFKMSKLLTASTAAIFAVMQASGLERMLAQQKVQR